MKEGDLLVQEKALERVRTQQGLALGMASPERVTIGTIIAPGALLFQLAKGNDGLLYASSLWLPKAYVVLTDFTEEEQEYMRRMWEMSQLITEGTHAFFLLRQE